MAHEYGHSTTTSTTTSARRQADTSSFVIKDFIINTDDIKASGESRFFSIIGDVGAGFYLEIRTTISNVEYYYNFTTRLNQTTPTGLDSSITSANGYEGNIKFPKATTALAYTILLLAKDTNTQHVDYIEVRDIDGSVDINASKGSNSLMLKKTISQVSDATLTITPISFTTATGFSSASFVSDSIIIQGTDSTGKIPFTISVTSANGSALRTNRDAFSNDFTVKSSNKTVGDQFLITGEDPFDNGQSARSTSEAVHASGGGDGVDVLITMNNAIGSPVKWAVGDRVTGNDELDDLTGVNAVTIVAISGASSNVLGLSRQITIDHGETLNFTEPYYRRWKIDDAYAAFSGLSVTSSASNVVADTSLSSFTQTTTGIDGERVIIEEVPAVEITSTPVYTIGGDRRLTLAAEANITFNNPQPLALSGDTINYHAYGVDNIRSFSGWDIEITDLVTTLTQPTTTITQIVNDSTTVRVALGHGIMDDVSTVSSPNMNKAVANPTVTNIGSYSGSTAILTLSSAQTLEVGETLTFDNAGQTITITGNIKINKSSGDAILNLDLEKFIVGTVET